MRRTSGSRGSSELAAASGYPEMRSNTRRSSSRKSRGAFVRFARHHRDSFAICAAAAGVGLMRSRTRSVRVVELGEELVYVDEVTLISLLDCHEELPFLLG